MSELINEMEKDQTEVLDRTENIKSLANQVKKLHVKRLFTTFR